ncbi:hypothetical protein CYLTODRAFT_369320, partial [Cylindrobasidium torrendii FP15055 ss-10]
MLELEHATMPSLTAMDQQPEIRWTMRPCLIDFLIEVHFTFRLRPETLYLAMNIVDRYVSRRIVYTKHYQLVGTAALWCAAKFEDAKDRVPSLQDLAQTCRDTYDESAFIQMECHILNTIGWTLGHPTAESHLRLRCCAPFLEDTQVQHVARFLMELTLFYRDFIQFPSSVIALGALTLARFLCDKPCRPFEQTTEIMQVVNLLDARLSRRVNDISATLVKKYSYAFYSEAATFVVQFYLRGGHFTRETLSPSKTFSGGSLDDMCMGFSSSPSDSSDDFPLTPESTSGP